ncbi:unnamed protein product, partial [marine sediment metagenome]
MAEKTDLRELLKPYSDKWVALSEDSSKVVGVGDTPKKALEQASSRSEKNPILTRVP